LKRFIVGKKHVLFSYWLNDYFKKCYYYLWENTFLTLKNSLERPEVAPMNMEFDVE